MTTYFYLTAYDTQNERREVIFGDFNKQVVKDELDDERHNLKEQGYKEFKVERGTY